MSVNKQRKNAMKRLAQDFQELQNQPLENVSAAPMDDNMLEWHCNFKQNDIIYHLILFFPEQYPYTSPSAEFVPTGFQYYGGATKQGRKGTQVCLNIFSDFANYHPEWKDQKGLGWSPGYTVQTVLLNVVAFLSETQSGGNAYEHNKKLSEKFSCQDCGHTYKNPFPAFELSVNVPRGTLSDAEISGSQIIDYISKEMLKVEKPKTDGRLFGYGLTVTGTPQRPFLTTPCEFLTLDSFNGMKKAMGKVHSVLKEEIKFFLPMYIHPMHGNSIKPTIENTLMNDIAALLPGCNPKTTSIEEMVLKTIPNLMSATVVEFSKGTQHTSDNSLKGYFALHRLLLWALETYPGLQDLIDDRLKVFVDDEKNRTKEVCSNIGEWLMLLSGSWKYRWQDVSASYLKECWRRQVMWYVKDDASLGYLDTPQAYRLSKTLEKTAVGRKLLAFQVLFLDIAMPEGKNREELAKRYDDNLGFPTHEMMKGMKESVDLVKQMKSFQDWFKVLKVPQPDDQEIFDTLVSAVKFAIHTEGYHWTFFKGAGGWMPVLQKYRPDKVPQQPKEDEKPQGRWRGGRRQYQPVQAQVVPANNAPKPKSGNRRLIGTLTLIAFTLLSIAAGCYLF